MTEMKNPEWKNGTLQTDNLRIQITNKHRNYPDEWIMHLRELNWNCKRIDLNADVPEVVAQAKAVRIIKDHLFILTQEITKL